MHLGYYGGGGITVVEPREVFWSDDKMGCRHSRVVGLH